MVIWKDVPVKIRHKTYCSIKVGGKKKAWSKRIIVDYGDLPIGSINETTMKFEPCVNTRGYGYACRLRMKYRKK